MGVVGLVGLVGLMSVVGFVDVLHPAQLPSQLHLARLTAAF